MGLLLLQLFLTWLLDTLLLYEVYYSWAKRKYEITVSIAWSNMLGIKRLLIAVITYLLSVTYAFSFYNLLLFLTPRYDAGR